MIELDTRTKGIVISLLVLLSLITFLTNFYGSTDVHDYGGVAKFFSGKYDAKIRTSHSYLYGFIHTPLVGLFENYFTFKVTSLLSLILIIYSVYRISGRDRKALLLITLSPIVWYMAPWVSPIQLASLLFLWGWYFIREYDSIGTIKNLIYSALLVGLSWAFWDGILFFVPLLMISFLYDRKLLHSVYFLIFVLIGSLPRMILDQALFGFVLFTPVRHIGASLALTFFGGFYSKGSLFGIHKFLTVILFIPFYSFLILKRGIFLENKKTNIFILLAIMLIVLNSQIRFVLLVAPIAILAIFKNLNRKKFIVQVAISLILILIVINPYIIETKYEILTTDKTSHARFWALLFNINNLKLSSDFTKDLISEDLKKVSNEFPNEIFVVGNKPDDYQILADLYWSGEIEEFVSIQDYNMDLSGNPVLSEKIICSETKIKSRRDICASMLIRKAFNDKTDYDSIRYALSEEKDLDLEGFSLIREYDKLYLFEKDLN